MNTDRPLDGVTSIKLKLGVLVGASVLAGVLVAAIGDGAGVPWWTSLPVTAGAAVAVTQWLARGMTSPLREMTGAARRMAAGDYGQRVATSSSDEVGELARAFNAMAADLAGADLERRRLVATVSHELRTPLTAQRALLENLVDGVSTPDRATLESALAQAERLSALVEDLLDLSRVDAGVAPLALAPVRVESLLTRAVDEVRVAARPVRVRHRVSPPDLTVTGDAARLAQLVANLVDNALRHSPAHGDVRLDARVGEAGRWVLEVRDDGPGIPAADAERVFERFGTGADAAGGTGLGLAIVRWVCELHGGRVEVVPTPAGATGATLRVTLPTAPSDRRPSHVREELAASTPSSDPVPPTTPEPVMTATSSAPAVPYGGGAGPVDGAVARLWPEPDGRPRIGVVAAALGIGLLGALTWVDRNIGLVTSLVMLATGGAHVGRRAAPARPVDGRRRGRRRPARARPHAARRRGRGRPLGARRGRRGGRRPDPGARVPGHRHELGGVAALGAARPAPARADPDGDEPGRDALAGGADRRGLRARPRGLRRPVRHR
ncbi:hypothetical protein PDTK01_34620 [Phycicoccus sp. DTK01]|nr:hypothetical protein PDTK01_34620 [Phycicoccus sp. DTK01]